jgi:hypothetical protein
MLIGEWESGMGPFVDTGPVPLSLPLVHSGPVPLSLHQGRSPEGRRTRVEAVEQLSRAIQLDPTRVADEAKLEQIMAGPAHSQE